MDLKFGLPVCLLETKLRDSSKPYRQKRVTNRKLISSNQSKPCPWRNRSEITSNTHALFRLTKQCGYDKWTRPGSNTEPLQVHTRIFVYFLGSIEAHYLQFTAHILVRFRWRDPRLEYKVMSPSIDKIVGEGVLRNQIWVPHVYLVNEHESKMMGADQQDVLITALPDGTIYYSTR
ncbi:hypothetical protein RUM43_007608 [Polyplax serrata]|uniref:Neurotransmitter-gated ion-channel ligand-binding domain-containing protein n=1 Tax=Polyplax serrata TaxID=468196 RepID=A0AAN8PMU7_POLSC